MVVYSWTKIPPEVMADLSIHYTYCLVLDDSTDDPHSEMATFFEDLVHGRQQKHPWWRLVNDHFPKVLNHYGSFCALNLIRSTFDCKWLSEPRVLDPGQFGRLNPRANFPMPQSSRVAGLSSTTFTAFLGPTITLSSSAA